MKNQRNNRTKKPRLSSQAGFFLCLSELGCVDAEGFIRATAATAGKELFAAEDGFKTRLTLTHAEEVNAEFTGAGLEAVPANTAAVGEEGEAEALLVTERAEFTAPGGIVGGQRDTTPPSYIPRSSPI